MDDPVTIKYFSSPPLVLLFPSAKFISYGAPVINIPYSAKATICHAKVILICDTVLKKGGKEWVAEAV